MQLEVGEVLVGKVTGLTNFGAFVELPEGKTGMVHISEVSTAYVNEIRDHLKEGQEVKVKVLNITEEGKISLSIRRALDQPREQQQPRHFNNNRAPRPPRNFSRPPRPAFDGKPQEIDFQSKRNDSMSFEDMMLKYKQVSEDKMSDLKRGTEAKHGGFSRRGSRSN